MKKNFLWAALLIGMFITLSEKVFAQQIPLYSQYFANPFIYNPAWAGLDKFGSVNITHRNQWDGIEGAPVTNLITVDLPFFESRSGFGVNAHQDNIGIFRQNKVMFSYAYHIFSLYENSSYFSFGLSAGFNQTSIDFNKAYILHPNDPKILSNTGNYMSMEFAFGMNYIFKDKFQIGFSIPQFLNGGVRNIDEADNNLKLKPHYLLTARCTLKTYDEMHRIEPMIMARYVQNTPMQLDFGVQYTFNNIIWTNAAYRFDYGAVVGAGVSFNNLRFGYSRDFSTGQLQGFAGGTNEIMLGYKFGFLKSRVYGAPKGRSNTDIKRKVEHPSMPGPGYKKPLYKRNTPKINPKKRKN